MSVQAELEALSTAHLLRPGQTLDTIVAAAIEEECEHIRRRFARRGPANDNRYCSDDPKGAA